jgi:hypothetical protein
MQIGVICAQLLAFMPGGAGEEVVDHAAELVSWCDSCGISTPA